MDKRAGGVELQREWASVRLSLFIHPIQQRRRNMFLKYPQNVSISKSAAGTQPLKQANM